MRGRQSLIKAFMDIKTHEAVSSAAENIHKILRRCRSNNLAVRGMLPAIYVRLGRDQDAYNVIKWYNTSEISSYQDWIETDVPHPNGHDADIFESHDYRYGRGLDLAGLTCITLLKIRLLFDLMALANSAFLAQKLPQELVDWVKVFVPSTDIVRASRETLFRTDYSDLITKLTSQIYQLYLSVVSVDKDFWPGLLHPGANPSGRPDILPKDLDDAVWLKSHYCHDAWIETPGAIEFIQTISVR
ncbi:MAG: hypothetical protein Q9169_007875 [Polycauliona sp. 2 TL-2023]